MRGDGLYKMRGILIQNEASGGEVCANPVDCFPLLFPYARSGEGNARWGRGKGVARLRWRGLAQMTPTAHTGYESPPSIKKLLRLRTCRWM